MWAIGKYYKFVALSYIAQAVGKFYKYIVAGQQSD